MVRMFGARGPVDFDAVFVNVVATIFGRVGELAGGDGTSRKPNFTDLGISIDCLQP